MDDEDDLTAFSGGIFGPLRSEVQTDFIGKFQNGFCGSRRRFWRLRALLGLPIAYAAELKDGKLIDIPGSKVYSRSRLWWR